MSPGADVGSPLQNTHPLSGCSKHPLRPRPHTGHMECAISCFVVPLPLGAPKCRPATRGHCGPQGWHLVGGGQGAAQPWSSEPHCQPQPPPSVPEHEHPWGGGNPGATGPLLRGPGGLSPCPHGMAHTGRAGGDTWSVGE